MDSLLPLCFTMNSLEFTNYEYRHYIDIYLFITPITMHGILLFIVKLKIVRVIEPNAIVKYDKHLNSLTYFD